MTDRDDPPRGDQLDMRLVAWIVRIAGVDCVHVADDAGDVLLAGRLPASSGGDHWAARARRRRSDVASSGGVAVLWIGPDDGGESTPVRVVTASDERQIAALVVAQALRSDPSRPLDAGEIHALGLSAAVRPW